MVARPRRLSSHLACLPNFSERRLETVRKGVRVTLRACIWPAYGGQNGPDGTARVPRVPAFRTPPGHFIQFLGEVRDLSHLRVPHSVCVESVSIRTVVRRRRWTSEHGNRCRDLQAAPVPQRWLTKGRGRPGRCRQDREIRQSARQTIGNPPRPPQCHHNPVAVHGVRWRLTAVGNLRKPLRFGLRRPMAANRRILDRSENHGVPGSNPGPATYKSGVLQGKRPQNRTQAAPVHHISTTTRSARSPRRIELANAGRCPLAFSRDPANAFHGRQGVLERSLCNPVP